MSAVPLAEGFGRTPDAAEKKLLDDFAAVLFLERCEFKNSPERDQPTIENTWPNAYRLPPRSPRQFHEVAAAFRALGYPNTTRYSSHSNLDSADGRRWIQVCKERGGFISVSFLWHIKAKETVS